MVDQNSRSCHESSSGFRSCRFRQGTNSFKLSGLWRLELYPTQLSLMGKELHSLTVWAVDFFVGAFDANNVHVHVLDLIIGEAMIAYEGSMWQ